MNRKKAIIEELRMTIERLYSLEEDLLKEGSYWEEAERIRKKRDQLEQELWQLEHEKDGTELSSSTDRVTEEPKKAVLYSIPSRTYQKEETIALSNLDSLSLDDLLNIVSEGILKSNKR